MRGAGLALGRVGVAVGRELARGGPSSQERMKKMGYGVTFKRPFGSKWTASSKKVESYIETGRFTRDEKDAIRQMIKNTVPEKQWSPHQKGIRQEDMEEAFEIYEKKFGQKVTNEFRKAVGLEEGSDPRYSKFFGGRQRKVEDVIKDLQRAKGMVGKWKMPYAEQVIKGLYPTYQKNRKTFDQQKAYAVREEIGKTFGPTVQAKFDRALEAEIIPSEKKPQGPNSGVATTREARLGTFAQPHGVRSVATTREAAREPSLRLNGKQNALSRLKSFINK